MKRFKITLMIPHSKEFVAADAQAAHNIATHLAGQTTGDVDNPPTMVHSIIELGEEIEPTRELEFGDDV